MRGVTANGSMLPRMWEKGYELRDKMLASLADPFYLKPEKACDDVPGARVMDMFGHLSNAALDIIGLVAIGEDLGALSDRQNDLRTAYQDVLRVGFITDWLTVLRFAMPLTRKIPVERGRVVKRSRETVERFGHRVIAEKRRLLQDMHAGRLEKKTDIGKDVLSLLIKANAAADLRPDQRLDDTEVIAQITTMLFTGHETTSTATGFCLRQLSLHPAAQAKLRRELLEAGSDEPDFDTLMALPYLHNVVRESLRLEGPVPNMGRVATEDVVIPLSRPIAGRDGKMMDTVELRKGDYVQARECPTAYNADAHSIPGRQPTDRRVGRGRARVPPRALEAAQLPAQEDAGRVGRARDVRRRATQLHVSGEGRALLSPVPYKQETAADSAVATAWRCWR